MNVHPTPASLPALISTHPEIWQGVLKTIQSTVQDSNPEKLGHLRHKAHLTLKSTANNTSPDFIAAQMTVFGLDQFADAVTGKIAVKPKLRDRIVFAAWILSRLEKGVCPSLKEFDTPWSWLKDPLWASGELQRQGFWSVPTKELLNRLRDHIGVRQTLEVGSGRGLLSAGLATVGVSIQGVDDGTWEGSSKVLGPAKKLLEKTSAETSVQGLKPEVVICSWPPPGNNFEKNIFSTPSVELYIAILSKHRFASGNWKTYQEQTSFTCTTAETLNALLRPVELDQQVLIFRRTRKNK